MISADIFDIANQAGLRISADDKIVDIKHKFCLGDKSTWGILFFLCGGIFLTVIPFIKTLDTTSKILGIAIGLLLLGLSILTLLRLVADGLTIKDDVITFRHNLNKNILPLSTNMKIKMKTETLKIRRVATLGSEFILVTHYLQHLSKEIPILKFQMDCKNADNAKKLGTEITRIINDKIR